MAKAQQVGGSFEDKKPVRKRREALERDAVLGAFSALVKSRGVDENGKVKAYIDDLAARLNRPVGSVSARFNTIRTELKKAGYCLPELQRKPGAGRRPGSAAAEVQACILNYASLLKKIDPAETK